MNTTCKLRATTLFVSVSMQMVAATGGPESPITSVQAIRALKADEAAKKTPVHLRGVVTALSGWKNSFFLQNASGGISIDRNDTVPELHPGERVEVSGVAAPGQYAPIVQSNEIRVLGKGQQPPARSFELGQLLGGQQDSQRISMRGVVRSAEIKVMWERPILFLRVETGMGEFVAHVLNFGANFDQLVDAAVTLRGVCGTNFNSSHQFAGIRLFVNAMSDIIEEKPAAPNPFALPVRPINTLLQYAQEKDQNHRVRVRGIVTYQQPGKDLYIQSGEGALAIRSQQCHASVGTEVEVVGFAIPGTFSPVLQYAVCKPVRQSVVAAPVAVEADRMFLIKDGFKTAPYEGVLVTLQAELLESTRTGSSQLFLMKGGDSAFEARLENQPGAQVPLAASAEGSILRLTGVAVTGADQTGEPKDFRILLRSAADVQLIRRATWWNAQHALWVLAFTAFTTIITMATLIALRRRIREQRSELAKRREHSRLILESANDAFIETDVNGRILEWNKQAEQVFGWKRAQALRKNFVETMLPERFQPTYLERLEQLQQKAQSAVMNKSIELTALDQHGHEFPVDLTVWSIEGDGKTIFTAFVRDISQRKFAEDLLKRSEEFNRQILESSPDCIEVLGNQGNLISINARGCQLKEIEDVMTVVALYWPSFWPEHAHGAAEEALRDAQLGREGALQAFRPTAKGNPKWWDVRVTAIADENGAPDRLLVISRDITTQKLSEQALEASEARLQEAQEIAHLGYWDFDLITSKITWSEEAFRMFKLPNDMVITYEFYQTMMPAGDREAMIATVEHAIETGKPYELTHPATLNDGSLVYIEVHGRSERDASGRSIRLSGTVLDVTARVESVNALQASHDLLEERVEQRTAELARSKSALQESMKAVQKSEAEFRQLADSMPQIVWTAQPDGLVDYYNERWYAFTGFDRQLLGDQSWLPLLHPEDVQKGADTWSASVRSGATYEIEYRFWDRLSGTYRWHLGRALPSVGEDGRITKWFGTCTDIEDYKRAESEILALNRGLEFRVADRTAELSQTNEELRRTQSWLRAVLGSATQASIIAIDTEGVISLFNSGAEHLLGYSADDLVGKHTPELLHSEEYCRLREQRLMAELRTEHIGNIFAGDCQPKCSVVSEIVYVHRDGTQIDVSLATAPMISSNGERLGSLGIAVDISPRKLLERKLNEKNVQLQEQTRCAEDANRAKSQFLASMSHEIRTPMNAILGMADLLWESDLDSSQRKYVEVFRRAGGQLLTLVNDILDVSKIESGQFELEKVDFDLLEAVERTVELILPKTRAKHVALVSRIAPGIPPNVIGDPTRLQQVLINLLGNAVKFTEQGEITLTVTPDPADSYRLHFEINDTGIGIPGNKLESIFDDFTQAESSTTRRFGGTGLGLGICRRLVNLMDGHLEVTSELGKGSSFFFDAVFAKSTQERTPAAEVVVGLTGRKVLIVDNNETNRLIFMEMCNAWEMIPSECGTPEQATTILGNAMRAGQSFDLAILDRLMPGQDGFDLVSRIRSIDSGIPLILATSDKVPGDETRCKQLGLAGYAVKPVARGELLAMIRKALGASSAASASALKRPPSGRILIAEDSEDNRFLVQAYLKNSPYKLTFVENGELAVEAARSRSFDLVLMDMQMPVMDGLTATRLIREEEAGLSQSPVPILALTANARGEDFQASRQAGCDSHLSKPISKPVLLSAIQEHLRGTDSECEQDSLRIDIQPGLEEGAKRYIESRKKEVPGLMGLVQAQDFDQLRVLAHNIKGTGTSYGFPDLTRLAGQIEFAATEQDAASLSQQLLELDKYVERAAIAVDHLVPQGD